MLNDLVHARFLGLVLSMALACGPRVGDDQGEDAMVLDAAADGCDESTCPIACGERTCAGALGIGRCVDEECSPTPMDCVLESSPEKNCAEVCMGKGVVCVANGCEGATAYGYPGTEIEASNVCGESTPEVRAAVTPIEGPCDAPLVFTGEGAFVLYQCCCDDPSD